MDKNQAYTVIKQARSMMKTSSASEKTLTEYKQIYDRITVGGTVSPSQKIQTCTSRSSVTKMKSSLRYVLSEHVKNMLTEQDKLQRSGQNEEWLATVSLLKNKLDDLRQIDLMQPKSILKRRSKRQDLKGLPAGWQKTLLAEVQQKDQVAALVSAITGCRPSELTSGVHVAVSAQFVIVTIAGAKVTRTSGQPVRVLTYPIHDNELVQRLAASVGIGKHVIKIDDPRRFSTSVRDAGMRAFPGLRRTLTPYCFRHQVASNLKATLESDDVSRALGHCSDKTATRYGHSGQSKGGGDIPSEVVADRDVRHKAGLALERVNWKCPEISDPDILTSFTPENRLEF